MFLMNNRIFPIVLETGNKVLLLIFKMWSSSLNTTAAFRDVCSHRQHSQAYMQAIMSKEPTLGIDLGTIYCWEGGGLSSWKSRNNCQ